MKQMEKHKRVTIKCLKDSGQSHFEETFHNITEEQLKNELNKMIKSAPWDAFVVDCDGKVRTLVLNGDRRKGI